MRQVVNEILAGEFTKLEDSLRRNLQGIAGCHEVPSSLLQHYHSSCYCCCLTTCWSCCQRSQKRRRENKSENRIYGGLKKCDVFTFPGTTLVKKADLVASFLILDARKKQAIALNIIVKPAYEYVVNHSTMARTQKHSK